MIQSILDTDLYKFTMQSAVLDHFPGTQVEYKFNDRRSRMYNDNFLKVFGQCLERMADLKAEDEEMTWLKKTTPFLSPHYLSYLHEYRFDPNEVNYNLDSNGTLQLMIKGAWERAILWEVPLLALVSEVYFKTVDTAWSEGFDPTIDQKAKASHKGHVLSAQECTWAEFGTRRRRNFETQDLVVSSMAGLPGFFGTSNVHLARKYNCRPIGTMAHEWIMGVSAMDGLRRANRCALRRWAQTFKGRLGIALPDTFGTSAFYEDFDAELARLYDGVRHDSGDPMVFGDRLIEHYKSLGINPLHRFAVFTDSLTVDRAIEIQNYFAGRIGVSFGIGTHFTNDFEGSSPLNIVIKLSMCNGVPVVKISDEPGKSVGDKDALRVANWTFNKKPLDA